MITKEDLAVPVLLEMLLGDSLTETQQKWLDEYNSSSNVVHLTGERSSGKTSFTLALIAIDTVMNHDKASLVLTISNPQAMSHMKVCTHYIEKLVTWLEFKCQIEPKNPFVRRNSREIQLDTGSRIYFAKANSCAGRGMTLSNVFFDLCVPSMESLNDELIASILPCICATGGKLFVSLERVNG